jgi:hypothetical protein
MKYEKISKSFYYGSKYEINKADGDRGSIDEKDDGDDTSNGEDVCCRGDLGLVVEYEGLIAQTMNLSPIDHGLRVLS